MLPDNEGYQCRVLELHDYEALGALMESRDSFLAIAPESLKMHREISISTAYDLLKVGPSVGTIFGAYDAQGQLWGVAFTAISSAQPCYFLNKAYTRPGAQRSLLPNLFEFLILHYEKLGYQRFCTLYREQDIATYHRLWRTTTVLRNYVSYSDLRTEVNERPKYSDYWELMYGRILYPVPMVVRAFVRKSETMYFNE